MSTPLSAVTAEGLDLVRRGKVRDTFRLDDGTLLMVATDRVSAFDVVMPTAVPDKGRILTQMSRWWFARTGSIVPNHLRGDDPATLPPALDWESLGPRSMRVAAAERIDVECVVRGHLAGSGWVEYTESGTLASEPLPTGLLESSPLPQPRFTPAIKNDDGHDQNISRAQLAEIVGAELARRLEQTSLAIFAFATSVAAGAGMLVADTKFEFGFIGGELTLIDEVLTPDSSRFWEAATYREGAHLPAFDKQVLRDWLLRSGWDRQSPGPELPDDVVGAVRDRYLLAALRLCGMDLR